jgi:hypothetical protein
MQQLSALWLAEQKAVGSIKCGGLWQVGMLVGWWNEAGGGQLRVLASPDLFSFHKYYTVNLILGQKVTPEIEKYFKKMSEAELTELTEMGVIGRVISSFQQ